MMTMNSFIVLCGGMSRRMGQDKGSMILDGKPMIIHLLETLTNFADEIVIVLRDNDQEDAYKKLLVDLNLAYNIKFKICKDIIKGKGPLGGIYTGFQYLISNQALILPCDSPFVSEFFVKRILELSEDTEYDAVVPKWPDGRLEPLHSIYKKNSKQIILKLIKEGTLDVKSLINELNVKFVDIESLDPTGRSLFNINQDNDIDEYGVKK